MKHDEILKAADDARRLLRGFRAFEEVAQALEAAGQAVQTKAEAEAALATLNGELDKACIAVCEAKAELASVNAATKAKLDKAEADALVVAQTAKDAADRMAADARAVMDDAEAKGREIVAQAEAAAADVQAKRDALAAEVDDLEKRAEKARAYLAKLAG